MNQAESHLSAQVVRLNSAAELKIPASWSTAVTEFIAEAGIQAEVEHTADNLKIRTNRGAILFLKRLLDSEERGAAEYSAHSEAAEKALEDTVERFSALVAEYKGLPVTPFLAG